MTRPPTTPVVAALILGDDSARVLQTAQRLAELTGAEVETIHPEGADEDTSVPEALVGALEAPQVIAAVLGARVDPGEPGVGRTARYVLERTTKPVVVVPPGAGSETMKLALVPLEGTEASSRPILEGLREVVGAHLETVVLHVFTDESRPRMLDHPVRDLELLGREFLWRHLPQTERIELRFGPVAASVAEVSRELGADLIVLSWSQDSSEGRAAVIREVLGSSSLPVLVLPASGPGPSGRGPIGTKLPTDPPASLGNTRR